MTLSVVLVALALQTAPVTADQLSWMSGYWLSCDGGREVSETWSDPRGGVLMGTGMTMQGGRLRGFEATRISAMTAAGGDIAYHAEVDGASPVAFPAREVDGTRVVFENAEHDFPQRVIYERIGDVLNARIEGRIGDHDRAMSWSYRRAELNERCPA